MNTTLIIFSTTDGHTESICNYIGNILSKKDDVKIYSIENISEELLNSADKILIGASIRYGKHSKLIFDFVCKYKDILDSMDNAFFSVNAVARKSEKNEPDTNPYLIKFLEKSSWKPKKMAVFAGKIDYPKYKFIDKHVIRFIMLITGGPTDTKKSFEFTDWSKVADFANEAFD